VTKGRTQAEKIARGDWKAIRRRKTAMDAPPTRANLEAAEQPVMSGAELRAETKALLGGYCPWETAGEGETFDYAEGRRCIEFFHTRLTHTEGPLALKPLGLERWQQALLFAAFGWRRADGTRRYREVFLFVPRKNGKSTLAAGLVLYRLFEFEDIGQQVYSAAAARDQAALVFDTARKMVTQDPGLSVGFKIRTTTKRLEYPGTNSFYRALAAEAGTVHGLNPTFYVFDELHAQPGRELFDVLKTAVGAQAEPMAFYITTSDFGRPSICNEMRDYAVKVRDGAVADSAFLPAVYEAGADDDWRAPETWRRVNPNLGVSVAEDFLERECKRAMESPEFENTFKRLYLNIRTASDVAWLPMEAWDDCALEAPAEGPCYAGLDLASTEDLSALVLYWPDTGAVVPHFWVPLETARKRESGGRVPSYLTWNRAGFMDLTPGNVCDYAYIRKRVNELAAEFDLRTIAFDRYNASHIVQELQGDGIDVVPWGQGFVDMNTGSKALERMLLGRLLRHGGHPVLKWNAANAMAERDAAGNVKPSKKKSGDKIDGIVALVMALGLAAKAEAREWSPEVFVV